MACIHYASKMQELKVSRQIISSPLHLQRLPNERTGAIQLPKGEQHSGELQTETVPRIFWEQASRN